MYFHKFHLLIAITLCPPVELNLIEESCSFFTIWISVRGLRGFKPLGPSFIIFRTCFYADSVIDPDIEIVLSEH